MEDPGNLKKKSVELLEIKDIPIQNNNKKKKKKNKKKKNKENINPTSTGDVEKNVQPPIASDKTKEKDVAPKLPKKSDFAEDDAFPEVNLHQKTKEPVHEDKIPKISLGEDNEQPENAQYNADDDDSEDEGIEDYKIGGYHPVHIGEVLLERYVVIQKLGWGHFSTVWLCRDFKYETYVAIKIQKSAPHYLEAAYDEVEILQRVAKNATNPEWIRSLKEYYKDEGRTKFTKDDCHCVQLLNSFIYQGPYGNHFCMVFEILGVNLLEVIKRYNYKGVPMPLVRVLAKQILIGLDYLHRVCGIIHTDLKPENILLCLTKDEVRDIVENGQLSRSQQYHQRIQEYQKQHGIIIDPNQAQGGQDGAKKGKNWRKKQYRKKKHQKDKKKQEENAKLIELGYDPQTLDEETRAEILQELQEDEEEEEEPANTKETKKEAPKQNQNPVQTEQAQPTNPQEKGRGPKIDENVRIKIADLGNACWTHHHFTTKIQTRQYRSPEVILGIHYDTSADIWSFACTIFEMLTGDFLFEPRKGNNFSKNDDHFAQVMELLKLFPKKYVMAGKNFKKFFDKQGNLKRIQGFHYWPLNSVLTDKYQMKVDEAEAFTSFLSPMLEYYPLKRGTAQKMLHHRWLKMKPNYDYKMAEKDYVEFMAKRQQTQAETPDTGGHEIYNDTDDNEGDDESDFDYTSEKEADDESWYNEPHDNYGYKHLLNKSYDNGVYVGYADGIITGELDQEANWQFKAHKGK